MDRKVVKIFRKQFVNKVNEYLYERTVRSNDTIIQIFLHDTSKVKELSAYKKRFKYIVYYWVEHYDLSDLEFYYYDESEETFKKVNDNDYNHLESLDEEYMFLNFKRESSITKKDIIKMYDLKKNLMRKVNEHMNNTILYYSFDWDDNILFMPSKINVWDENRELFPVSTEEFAKYRPSIIEETPVIIRGTKVISMPKTKEGNVDYDAAFSNFRDFTNENLFLKDAKKAIKSKRFGPSWTDFIECLTTGSIFSIITARGHEDQTIREVVEYIINEYLNYDQKLLMYDHLLKNAYLNNVHDDYPKIPKNRIFTNNELVKDYLDLCEYVGVSAPSRLDPKNAMSPEKSKMKALIDFKRKINRLASNVGMKAKIGFSDDDNRTVGKIEDLYSELDHEEFPHIIEYVVKNTSDPKNITKKVIKRYNDFK